MPLTRRHALPVAAAVVLALALVLILFWMRPMPLPTGLIPAEGTYEVRILRDVWGVPHIFGRTDADVAYGLAWAHSEDDFETIQGALLAARGRLATALGRQGAPNDYMVQLLGVQDVVQAGYPQLSPEIRAVCQAYADGLNHFAALHPARALPALYPARGEDVVAGFVHKLPLFFGLDKVLQEIFDDERQSTVSKYTPPELRRSLARDASASAALRSLRRSPTTPRSQALRLRRLATEYVTVLLDRCTKRQAALRFPAELHGSNTFAIAPSRSADGSTLLLINSHQPWDGPVAWYEAHLRSEQGWDMVGGVFPGSPVVLHGHNRHLGWAHTVNRPDLLDVYVLELDPDDANRYRFDGEWRNLETRSAEIEVKLFGRLRWTVTREVLGAIHGPAVRRPHGTYALRFAGMGEVGQVEQWYQMNKARTFEQWRSAMRRLALPMFNTGYADGEGNIFYVYNGRLPLRADGYDWAQYLPGDTSEALWTESLPFDGLPQVLNPTSGFIQNCNGTPFQTTTGAENPTESDFATGFGIETAQTNRGLRALELLGADPSITLEELDAFKYDRAYARGSEMARLVERVSGLSGDEQVEAAQRVLAGWDLDTRAENPRAALAILALGRFLSVSGPSQPPTDDELAAALSDAARRLERDFGGLEVPLGEVQRLRRGEADLALGGGPDVLRAVYAEPVEDGRLVGHAGDSYVLVAAWDGEGQVRSRSIHQYGSATRGESSAHYSDQAELFVRRQMKPVWMDEAEIRAHLEREYRPGTLASRKPLQ